MSDGYQQQWAPQSYAPDYQAAPPPADNGRAPGTMPPLWTLGSKTEPAYGPYHAPYAGGPPAPPHKITPDKIGKILATALGRADMAVRMAIRRRFDISYIIIGIPLWFNIYNDYVVFTDDHVVFSRRTLWSGIKKAETFAVPYDHIDYFTLKRGSWAKLPLFGLSQAGDGGDVEVKMDKKAAGLLAWYFSAPAA